MSKMVKACKITPENDPGPQQSNGGEETADGEGKVDQGTISITFGRFNPPTVGHEKLSSKVAKRQNPVEESIEYTPQGRRILRRIPSMQGLKLNLCGWHIQITRTRLSIMTTCVLFLMYFPPSIMTDIATVNIVVGGDRVVSSITHTKIQRRRIHIRRNQCSICRWA